MYWQTARRCIDLDRPLVMGILNATPDSFSDGGAAVTVDAALRRVETMISEGADIVDIGGESTRPGGQHIDPEVELRRLMPIIGAITKRFDTPVSVDTSKAAVASAMLDEGAEIINDISGLRWDDKMAEIAASARAGIVLMHSRGTFESMHNQHPVGDIMSEVSAGLSRSIEAARKQGVGSEQIVLDVGIGFGKAFEQNLVLLAKLGKIIDEFAPFPVLVGASRKSFLGRLTGEKRPSLRVAVSVAAARSAIQNGASIVRVHDIRETVLMIQDSFKP